MYFRITPPKHSQSNALPASLYLNLDNIARVEEVRQRAGGDHPLTLKIFEKSTDRQHLVNEENTSPATMRALLEYLEKNSLNPKKEDGKWADTEKKVSDAAKEQAKPKEDKKPELVTA